MTSNEPWGGGGWAIGPHDLHLAKESGPNRLVRVLIWVMNVILAASLYYTNRRKDNVLQTIEFLENLRNILSQRYNVNAITVFVNTGCAINDPRLSRFDIKSSDNKLHEFSAYKKLLTDIINLNHTFSYVLLINDTVPSQRFYHPLLLASVIYNLMITGSEHVSIDILGRRDISTQNKSGRLEIDGIYYSARSWFSSHIFILSCNGSRILSDFLKSSSTTHILDSISTFSLDPVVYSHIHTWIYGRSFFKWRGSNSSLITNHELISTKIKCCMLERYLYPYAVCRSDKAGKFTFLFFLSNKLVRLLPSTSSLILRIPPHFFFSYL